MAEQLYEVLLTRQEGESGAVFLVTATSDEQAVSKARAELARDLPPERAVLYTGAEATLKQA